MKNIIHLLIFILILSSVTYAHSEETFSKAQEIINNNIPCDQLIDEQLEAIGEYYMEQVHPGEAHEIMDQMMGGEGSESLKQMHIQMAKGSYCEESSGMMGSGGMMGMMNMMGGGNMMNFGMMGTGMTGFSTSLFGLVYFALIAFLFSVIFWLTHNWIVSNIKIKKR